MTKDNPDEYMCPNCVTPWKCNGPHIEDIEDVVNKSVRYAQNHVSNNPLRLCAEKACELLMEGRQATQPEGHLSGGWEKIETAPKDGTTILACVAPYEASTCRWVKTPMERSGWCCEYPEAFEDEYAFEDYMAGSSYEPTHWMPLPPPPKEQS